MYMKAKSWYSDTAYMDILQFIGLNVVFHQSMRIYNFHGMYAIEKTDAGERAIGKWGGRKIKHKHRRMCFCVHTLNIK